MTEQEITDKVRAIIIDQLAIDDDVIKPESSFIDDLGADSLDTVELVMAFEEEFDLEITDDAAAKITTVQAAITHIGAAIN
jgi:acyl carrier protein